MTYEIRSYGRSGPATLKHSTGGYPSFSGAKSAAENLLRADQTLAAIDIVDEATGSVTQRVVRPPR